MTGLPEYDKRMRLKEDIYKKNKIKLVSVRHIKLKDIEQYLQRELTKLSIL